MPQSSYPATLDKLDEMLEFIMGAASQHGLDKSAVYKVRLAAEEVLVNIINYAYPEITGEIFIGCDAANNDAVGLCITIKDKGMPFNMLEQEDPDTSLPMEERQIGGLGIFLTKQVMDDIQYAREGDANILKLVKYA